MANIAFICNFALQMAARHSHAECPRTTSASLFHAGPPLWYAIEQSSAALIFARRQRIGIAIGLSLLPRFTPRFNAIVAHWCTNSQSSHALTWVSHEVRYPADGKYPAPLHFIYRLQSCRISICISHFTYVRIGRVLVLRSQPARASRVSIYESFSLFPFINYLFKCLTR